MTYQKSSPLTGRGWWKSAWLWLAIVLVCMAVLAAISPPEQTLGANARIVYLHGVWVWAALATILVSALAGLAGLLTRRPTFHRWSRALGRTGIFFWITYLPISLWAMQANWNGLFLDEPRWRLALGFAVSGLLLQVGLALMDDPTWASGANLIFAAVLLVALQTTQNVMHPPAPILRSDAPRIQFTFAALFLLALAAAWQVARLWHRLEAAFQDP